MIYVTEDTARSTIASLEGGDMQAYVEEFWERTEKDNPHLMAYSISRLSCFDSDAEREGFLSGICFAYELLRRQEEAEQMTEQWETKDKETTE